MICLQNKVSDYTLQNKFTAACHSLINLKAGPLVRQFKIFLLVPDKFATKDHVPEFNSCTCENKNPLKERFRGFLFLTRKRSSGINGCGYDCSGKEILLSG